MSVTDERLRWLSGPDYAKSEPGQIAAQLLTARVRIAQLEAALDWIIDTTHDEDLSPREALEEILWRARKELMGGSALETEAKFCNCGWPRTTDGEHGDNCPAKIKGEQT